MYMLKILALNAPLRMGTEKTPLAGLLASVGHEERATL
jgi:hypothetical protein